MVNVTTVGTPSRAESDVFCLPCYPPALPLDSDPSFLGEDAFSRRIMYVVAVCYVAQNQKIWTGAYVTFLCISIIEQC